MNETIADIVREMREYKGFPVPFAPMNAVWIDDFKALADRIEAAHRRERGAYEREAKGMHEALCEHDRLCEMLSAAEGNAAMREALERIVHAIEVKFDAAPTQVTPLEDAIFHRCKAALAAPLPYEEGGAK